MSPDDVKIADAFLAALGVAAETGDRSGLSPFLSPDVVWVTPMRELDGLEGVEEGLTWVVPPEHLDLEFAPGAWTDLGNGRLACDVHETYRVQGTDEIAYERDRRIECTLCEGLVSRYEMRIVG
jgi:hypothetical protein